MMAKQFKRLIVALEALVYFEMARQFGSSPRDTWNSRGKQAASKLWKESEFNK